MKTIADFCIIPMGDGVSVSSHIATCQKIFLEFNLKIHLHAYGTNIEGDWDKVMAALKRCHEVLHEDGVPRISTTVKIGTRIDKNQTMEDKVNSVRSKT